MKNSTPMIIRLSLLALTFIMIDIINAEPYLFQQYPVLKKHIPHIPLCDLPTPVVKLSTFGKHIDCENISMKCDHLSGNNIGDNMHLYGGNKPRKLEFLLAKALFKKSKKVITYGCAGSNHALATTIYARKLGLKPILMLKPQPNSHIVRQNLLLDSYYGAELHFFPDDASRGIAAKQMYRQSPDAYFIPTGGSNTIGMLGFVNAAFELAHQITTKETDTPDFIYIATGSCATTAGLLLGCQLAKIPTKIVAVCVEPEENDNEILLKIKKLFVDTNTQLNTLDPSIPIIEFPNDSLIINKNFCGTAYGLYLPETVAAADIFKNDEGVILENTYSAKPITAIMDDAAQGAIKNKNILFWNTYCSFDYSSIINQDDYKNLPQEFHTYFETDVQPLAKK